MTDDIGSLKETMFPAYATPMLMAPSPSKQYDPSPSIGVAKSLAARCFEGVLENCQIGPMAIAPYDTPSQRDDLLQKAMGALSDIGLSEDMTLEMARHKANRIYREIQTALGENGDA